MSAATTTPKPGRAVYPTVCPIHKLEYGRELVPSTPGHESYLIGNCPKCEQVARIEEIWESGKEARFAQVNEEAERQIAADESFTASIKELAQAWLSEDIQPLVDKWLRDNRERYEEAADKQRRSEIVEKVWEQKLPEFEQQREQLFAEIKEVK